MRPEPERGPFRADQVREGDRYEISNGHAIYVTPPGSRGARRTTTAGEVLDTDPLVTEAGIDAGYTPEPGMLRAPDVSVGHVPDTPGWIRGAPPLAVEYADVGQDEADLAKKIDELLAAGTQQLWVVRLTGPRRVEVHSPGQPVYTANEDDELRAPGILKNPVPVRALFDRDAAHEVVLRNLLERRGYSGLDAVRAEGHAEGRAEMLLRLIEIKFGAVAASAAQRVRSANHEELDRWAARVLTAQTIDDVFGG